MRKAVLIGLLLAIGVTATLALPEIASAAPVDEIRRGTQGVGAGNDGGDLGTQIQAIVNMLLFLLGAIAVVMIVIGGMRYTTSNGDSSSTKAAKDTILYAVIGLIIAIMAYAIVNFVVGAF